jgi:hypothetical protein
MNMTGSHRPLHSRARLGVLIAASLLLGACDPLSVTLLSAGASSGLSTQLGGINYRTFADSLLRVKQATLAALDKMKIQVVGIDKTDAGETIRAKMQDRTIEVELESLTHSATRVRAVARGEFYLVDSATSMEILQQTEKAL